MYLKPAYINFKKLVYKTLRMKNLTIKISTLLYIAFSFQPLYSQSFDFERAWGTYFGPKNTSSAPEMQIDHLNNIHFYGSTQIDNTLSASYYNQYVTGGGQNVTMNVIDNIINAKFSGSGNLLLSGYNGYNSSNVVDTENLIHIDGLGNFYCLKTKNTPITDAGSAGTWFSTSPLLSTNAYHSQLIKKNNSGTVIWRTFLPNSDALAHISSDENGNIYVSGSTLLQQGISTSGVFKTDFQIQYSGGQLKGNGFVAKLGTQGELLWATYIPAQHANAKYFNQQLFVHSGGDLTTSLPQLATSNTWQTNPASTSALTTLNSQTGTRLWGTYTGSGPYNGAYDFQVNSSGIYLYGYDTVPGSTYFATPNAYKTQVTGDTDYCLTKLDFTGNRVWGTYFGSDGYEDLMSGNISLSNQGVFITGLIYGTGSNIATQGAFVSSPPSNGTSSANVFFAQFDHSGNLKWSSYYGGTQFISAFSTNSLNIYATPDHASFYLYGSTNASTGISTPGAWQPQLPTNIGQYLAGFVAKFNYKAELSVKDTVLVNDLVLYDNPNNGNFSLEGKILEKESHSIKITDASGRLIHQQKLPKQKIIAFTLANTLIAGHYFLEVRDSKQKNIKTFKLLIKK